MHRQTDKGSDLAKEKMEQEAQDAKPERGPRRGPRGAQGEEKKSAGPQVVKAAKTRKLVAAGTADDVEIAQEIEEGEKEESA